MSHAATNWAIKQRGLPPTAKLVLWHLCDRYNPDHGCFPSQQTLANDCEISRRSLNNQLKILENKGFIRRYARTDPRSKRKRPTMYLFAFQAGFRPKAQVKPIPDMPQPCAKSAAKPMCKSGQTACANNSKNHVQNLHNNPVIETTSNIEGITQDAKAYPFSEHTQHLEAEWQGRLHELQAELTAAIGEQAQGWPSWQLSALAEPLNWLENGCHLHLDILPTLSALAQKAGHRQQLIGSWAYFREAVYRAKKTRLAPPAKTRARTNRAPKAANAATGSVSEFMRTYLANNNPEKQGAA